MTVDPETLQVLAELLADATSDLPVVATSIERGWERRTVDQMDDILAELKPADLVPAVRAAAYRLAARAAEAVRNG